MKMNRSILLQITSSACVFPPCLGSLKLLSIFCMFLSTPIRLVCFGFSHRRLTLSGSFPSNNNLIYYKLLYLEYLGDALMLLHNEDHLFPNIAKPVFNYFSSFFKWKSLNLMGNNCFYKSNLLYKCMYNLCAGRETKKNVYFLNVQNKIWTWYRQIK